VIYSTSVLDQGCVMIKPDNGEEFFPPSVGARPEEDDPYERKEFKVTILGERIWWWRDDSN
jgi:hypothetical protein